MTTEANSDRRVLQTMLAVCFARQIAMNALKDLLTEYEAVLSEAGMYRETFVNFKARRVLGN